MHYVPGMILKPVREQCVGGSPLRLSEIPSDFLRELDLDPPARGAADRLIFCREIRCGTSRFYLSEAFQRDVVSTDEVRRVWAENRREVKDIWMSSEDRPRYAKCMFQLFVNNELPGSLPRPVNMIGTMIRTAGGGERRVDLRIFLHIINLDHAFNTIEIINHNGESRNTGSGDELSVLDFMQDIDDMKNFEALLNLL